MLDNELIKQDLSSWFLSDSLVCDESAAGAALVPGCVWGWGVAGRPLHLMKTLLTYFSRDLHLCEASEARLNGGGPTAGIGWVALLKISMVTS